MGFLGLGAQAPEPEWGKMLSDSRQYIQKAPWTVIFPGLSIVLTVPGFNLIGDGRRGALGPRMKNEQTGCLCMFLFTCGGGLQSFRLLAHGFFFRRQHDMLAIKRKKDG